MTFRSFALLAFSGGTIVLVSALTLLGEAPGVSPEAAHLREMKERTDAPAAYARFTHEDMVALPHGVSLEKRAKIEARSVMLEGWVQRILLAGDGDLHLEVAPGARPGDAPDTAYVTAEITPRWRSGHAGWGYERLAEALRPNRGGPTRWEGGPRRARVSGWLLYDYQYDGTPSPWSLTHGACRVSGWEIHPVTRLELWNDVAQRWNEVAR